jgi:LHFPL tetraspan subfamily member protein
VWFLLNILATTLLMISLFTPNWLVFPFPSQIESGNVTVLRYPSYGLSSRCKKLSSGKFECQTFTLTTPTEIFPFFWKLSYIFMALAFAVLCITCLLTVLSFCKSVILGKSLHSTNGFLQFFGGTLALISAFFYPFGWQIDSRISIICIDISPFYPGECDLGFSFYSAVVGVVISMVCGVLSLKAEKASMNPSIKRRIEEGNERLVFAP